jgi:hypothetical protein
VVFREDIGWISVASVSEVARRRLAASMVPQGSPSGFDLIEDFVGSVVGGPRNMSVRMKDYLKSMGYGSSKRSR